MTTASVDALKTVSRCNRARLEAEAELAQALVDLALAVQGDAIELVALRAENAELRKRVPVAAASSSQH